jgi:hypothetical protein
VHSCTHSSSRQAGQRLEFLRLAHVGDAQEAGHLLLREWRCMIQGRDHARARC